MADYGIQIGKRSQTDKINFPLGYHTQGGFMYNIHSIFIYQKAFLRKPLCLLTP